MIRPRTMVATLAALAVVTASLAAPSPRVAGTATLAAVPCTRYETALLAASLHHGHTIRLACTPGLPV